MKLKAGKYFIGDLSYVVRPADWEKMIWLCDDVGEMRGHSFHLSGTTWGDGLYSDNEGYTYGVDTGTIGIAPITLCVKEKIKTVEARKLGRVVTFNKSIEVAACNGRFEYGHIKIDTNQLPEDDEDE